MFLSKYQKTPHKDNNTKVNNTYYYTRINKIEETDNIIKEISNI